MKKIFSLFSTALVALFGLTCCGGGGGSSEAGYMSIEDFAVGAKKFVTTYGILLEIVPDAGGSNGEYTPIVEDLQAQMVTGKMVAGGDGVDTVFTYWMDEPDARVAYLSFSITDSVGAEALTNQNILAGLGFAVLATDESSGTSIVLPNTVTSISGMNCKLTFDFDAMRMENVAEFVNVKDTATGETYTFKDQVANGVVPFAVYPR